MHVMEQKKILRRQMEAKRSALTESERKVKSEFICQSAIRSFLQPLLVNRESARAQATNSDPILLTYISTKAEVQVSTILEWCWLHRVAVAAPRVVSEGRRLTLHIIESPDDLQAGAYGILEPKDSVPELDRLDRMEAILVPGLAFDHKMSRLGYGGGYYDRFMRRYVEQTGKQPLKLGLAYDVQIIPTVPMAPHDLLVDAVITETRVWPHTLS